MLGDSDMMALTRGSTGYGRGASAVTFAVWLACGCSQGEYLYERPPERFPACPRSADAAFPESLVAAKDSLVAFWTFDKGAASTVGPWPDDTDRGYSLVGEEGLESARTVSTAPETRAGVDGSALRFEGDAAVSIAPQVDLASLFASSFTLAAWIAFDPKALADPAARAGKDWTILSTFGEACEGAELFVHWGDSGREGDLVFRVRVYVEDLAFPSESRCVEKDVSVPLQQDAAFSWSHVAASYDAPSGGGEAELALYLGAECDASSVSSVVSPASLRGRPTAQSFRVGARRDDQDSQAGFVGLIDDIAVFGRALPAAEISAFVQDKCSVRGPSGCRWSTWSSADIWGFGESSARWAPDSKLSRVAVSIQDASQGQAGVAARLSGTDGSGRDLSNYATAHLTASLPANQQVLVFLYLDKYGSYCGWSLLGGGEGTAQQEYELDLAHPSFCDSSVGACELNLEHVVGVRVASELAKNQGEFELAVAGLEFARAESSGIEVGNYSGVLDLRRNLCWHPKAYEPGATAGWAGDSTDGTLRAHIQGGTGTGSSLAATFPSGSLNVSAWCGVRLEVRLPSDVPTFVLNDANGMWRSWDADLVEDGVFDVRFADACTDPFNAGADVDERDYVKLPPFDPTRIASLAVQKYWYDEVDSVMELDSIEPLSDCEVDADSTWLSARCPE